MTTSFAINPTDAIPPSESSLRSAGVTCRISQIDFVGGVLQAESELDACIAGIASLASSAEKRGDIETAKELSRRMLAAINSRTPEHVARLEQEAWNELQDTIDYFQAQGERDRAALFDVSAQAVRRRMA